MVKKWGAAFLVFFVAMGACSAGLKDVREAAANKAPVDVACRDFVADRPAHANKWVRLTGAAGNLAGSAVRTKNDVANMVYVPLLCEGSNETWVQVVLASADGSLIAAAGQNVPVKRDFSGMVRLKKDYSTETTSGGGLDGGCAQCTAKIDKLAPDFVVLEEGVSPSMVRGLGWLALAIGAAVFMVKLARGE
jgi:hypothetical protein